MVDGNPSSSDKTRLDIALALAGAVLTGLCCMYFVFAGLRVAFAVPLALITLALLVAGIA